MLGKLVRIRQLLTIFQASGKFLSREEVAEVTGSETNSSRQMYEVNTFRTSTPPQIVNVLFTIADPNGTFKVLRGS
jgi:hypothetical protein